MVVFDSVSKFYGDKEVFSELSFMVGRQEICGIMGKNGAGKSTLLHILNGELDYSGKVLVEQCSPFDYKNRFSNRLFFLNDSPHVYDYLTIEEYVRFVLEVQGVSFFRKKKMYEELLEIMDLYELQNSLIKGFSFGMKRKVKLISIFLLSPQLLIMDEPTLGLDAPSVVVFKKLISQFAKSGSTVVVASHEPDFLKSICGHVVILHNRKIAYEEKNLKNVNLDLNQIYMNIVGNHVEDKIKGLFEDK